MYRVRFHLVLRHFTGKNIKRQSQDNNSFLVLFLVTYRFPTTIVFWKMFGGRYSILLLRRYLREKRNIHNISFLAQNLKILPVSTCHTSSRAKALFTLAKPLPDACKHSKKMLCPSDFRMESFDAKRIKYSQFKNYLNSWCYDFRYICDLVIF